MENQIKSKCKANFRKSFYFFILILAVGYLCAAIFSSIRMAFEVEELSAFQVVLILSTISLPLVFFSEFLYLKFVKMQTLRDTSVVQLLSLSSSHEADMVAYCFNIIALLRNFLAKISININIFIVSLLHLEKISTVGVISIQDNVFLQASLIFIVDSFLQYWIHRFFHRSKVLFELHKIHHLADEMTILNSLRDHPFLDILSGVIRSISISVLFGATPLLGFIYLIKNVYSLVLHSKISISFGKFNRIFVSPKNHFLHHEVSSQHYDKNFSTDLAILDVIFGTFDDSDATNKKMGLVVVKQGQYDTFYPLVLIYAVKESWLRLWQRNLNR